MHHSHDPQPLKSLSEAMDFDRAPENLTAAIEYDTARRHQKEPTPAAPQQVGEAAQQCRYYEQHSSFI